MSLTRLSSLGADQDSVRLLAVEACGPLARLLNKGESVQHVLPIVQKFAQVCCALLVVTLQASGAVSLSQNLILLCCRHAFRAHKLLTQAA